VSGDETMSGKEPASVLVSGDAIELSHSARWKHLAN